MSDNQNVIDASQLDTYSATELCLAARDMLNNAKEKAEPKERKAYLQALRWVESSLELIIHAYSVCATKRGAGEIEPRELEEVMDIDAKTKAYAIEIIQFASNAK